MTTTTMTPTPTMIMINTMTLNTTTTMTTTTNATTTMPMNVYLKGWASILPPMISTNSVVSFISGSNAMLPPGELSNINPKSRNINYF